MWPPLLAPNCKLPSLPEERWGASLDVQATRLGKDSKTRVTGIVRKGGGGVTPPFRYFFPLVFPSAMGGGYPPFRYFVCLLKIGLILCFLGNKCCFWRIFFRTPYAMGLADKFRDSGFWILPLDFANVHNVYNVHGLSTVCHYNFCPDQCCAASPLVGNSLLRGGWGLLIL